jgi:hypothetical protein
MSSAKDNKAKTAIDLVYGERAEQYGHPAEVYAHVARLWEAYLGRPVSATDVAMLMTLFKIGRQMHRDNEDNIVDAHGYLLVYERIMDAAKDTATVDQPIEGISGTTP